MFEKSKLCTANVDRCNIIPQWLTCMICLHVFSLHACLHVLYMSVVRLALFMFLIKKLAFDLFKVDGM